MTIKYNIPLFLLIVRRLFMKDFKLVYVIYYILVNEYVLDGYSLNCSQIEWNCAESNRMVLVDPKT